MTYALNKMPQTEGIGAGQSAITRLPTGPTYFELGIRYTQGAAVDATEANFQADFDEVRVIVDEEPKVRVSGADLLAINKFHNRPFFAGHLPIIFARPDYRTAEGEDELSYGTLDVQNMSVEVDLDAAAVTPAMSVYAVIGAPTPLGRHMTMRSTIYQSAAIGIHEIADLARGFYGLAAMHIVDANVDDVEVVANQRKVWEADRPIAEGFYADRRSWQTGYFHIDFQARNRISESLNLVLEDFRAKINFSVAPGAYTVIQERIEQRVPAGLPNAVGPVRSRRQRRR